MYKAALLSLIALIRGFESEEKSSEFQGSQLMKAIYSVFPFSFYLQNNMGSRIWKIKTTNSEFWGYDFLWLPI